MYIVAFMLILYYWYLRFVFIYFIKAAYIHNYKFVFINLCIFAVHLLDFGHSGNQPHMYSRCINYNQCPCRVFGRHLYSVKALDYVRMRYTFLRHEFVSFGFINYVLGLRKSTVTAAASDN
jgi:hypothetical protein